MKNLKEKTFCLIPARKGSKRIKNKNIKNFFGKPLLYYAINTARKSGLFDKIIVSSKKVMSPAHVRYGWKNWFVGTLFNSEGLPASSFSSM